MTTGTVCVIGAGPSGLAAVKALAEQGIEVECLERSSEVGGHWRYNNDSELSAAYASLVTKSSRERTEFPSIPLV